MQLCAPTNIRQEYSCLAEVLLITLITWVFPGGDHDVVVCWSSIQHSRLDRHRVLVRRQQHSVRNHRFCAAAGWRCCKKSYGLGCHWHLSLVARELAHVVHGMNCWSSKYNKRKQPNRANLWMLKQVGYLYLVKLDATFQTSNLPVATTLNLTVPTICLPVLVHSSPRILQNLLHLIACINQALHLWSRPILDQLGTQISQFIHLSLNFGR